MKEKIRKGYHLYDGYRPVDSDLYEKWKKYIRKSFTWANIKDNSKGYEEEASFKFANELEEEERNEVETAISALRSGYSAEINDENISKLI